jgi:hypothetical protein
MSSTSNKNTFAPRSYPVRHPLETGRRHGQVINPPRLPEIGGMTKSNADKRESELSIKKPGGTK